MKKWISIVDDYYNLEDNWDGYGASSIKDVAISKTKFIIQEINSTENLLPDFVTPTRQRGIVMEYKFNDLIISYSINQYGDIKYLVVRNYCDILEKGTIDISKLIYPKEKFNQLIFNE